MKVLPEGASDHPAFFDKSELEWLKGSTLLEQLEIDKGVVAKFYGKIVEVDPTFKDRHSLEKFMLYYYLLCSRYFGIHAYDPKRAFLIPYADLTNTGPYNKRNVTWDYDSARKLFRFFALAPIAPGEPVQFLSVSSRQK